MSFPQYPEYKDSGVEWLGEVPAHWRLDRSDAYIDSMAEAVSAERLSDKEVFHYSIPVVQETGNGRYEDGSEIESSKLLISQSQVLVSKLNPRKGTVCLAAPQDVVTVCSGEFVPLSSKSLSLEFLLYLVRTTNYRFRLESMVESATRSHQRASPSDIAKFRWAFPPEGEQVKIAAFLNHETARIDALVEQQQRLIELLKEKRQAVISHAVTKGLNPDVPMKDSSVEWLGEVPAHWEKLSLKRVTNIRYGIGEPPAYLDSGVPLIRATNVSRGKITQNGMVFVDPQDIPKKRILWLKDGDIIVVRSGAYTGDSAIIKEAALPSIAGFDMVVTAVRCFPDFLQYALISQYLKENQIDLEKLRAAQPHLNAEELGACFLLLPPSEEQKVIATFLDAEASKIDSMMEIAKKGIGYLKERRSALISAAVTGKIDVRGWTPPVDAAPTQHGARMEAV